MTLIRGTLMALVAAGFPMAAIRAQCGADVQRLLNACKFGVARAQLDARLARTDKGDALLDCRGRVELEAGKADDAVTWIEKAVALNPGNAAHHEALGLALRYVGRSPCSGTCGDGRQLEKAREHAAEILKVNPVRGHRCNGCSESVGHWGDGRCGAADRRLHRYVQSGDPGGDSQSRDSAFELINNL